MHKLLRQSPYFYAMLTFIGLIVLNFFDVAFAQNAQVVSGGYTSCGEDSIFSPPCTDKSVEYLSRIFGKVGGVLTGAEGTILQEMFSIFNAAVLGLGSIIIMYTLFVGTVKTAHEGEMLGQKWSSIWIPIKSALGIIMIVPANASGGYSFIQVFFMWVVIQGVGAADELWATILNGLSEQRPVIPQPVMLGSKMPFEDAFRGLVCMYALNKLEEPDAAPSYAPQFSGNQMAFVAGPYGNVCGTMTVKVGGEITGNVPASAMQESLGILQEAAMSVVYEDKENWPSQAILKAMQSYNSELSSKVREFKRNDGGGTQMNEAMRRARDLGWIFAGSYYYDIARIQDRISIETFEAPSTTLLYQQKFAEPTAFNPPNASTKHADFRSYITRGDNYIDQNSSSAGQTAAQFASTSSAGAFSAPSGGGLSMQSSNSGQMSSVSSSNPARKVTDFIYSSLNELLGFFQEHMSGEDPDTGKQINPIFAMQSFGTMVLFIVEMIWISITVILAVLGGVSTVLAFIPGVGSATQTFMMALISVIIWIVSWLSPMLMLLFIIGGVLSHYVPLIPFLLFSFGAIGWLMLVFEAMVAAPIVALGILHPEEHDIWGKANPALMLLTNVFLTPSLMLFGLVGAMMLSFVVVSMINFGFYNTMTVFSGVNESGTTGAIVLAVTSITTFICFIFIYMATIMYAVEKCFSLIPELRTKVLTWIGGQAQGFGEEAGLRSVKEGHEKGMQAQGQLAQKGAEGSGQAAKFAAGKVGGKSESNVPFSKS